MSNATNMVDLRAYKSGFLTVEQARSINLNIDVLQRFIVGLPKAELHVHIEGTLEPAQMLAIAKRNELLENLEGYYDVDGNDNAAWCKAQVSKRKFRSLQDFLNLYYSACDIMRTEEDFYDLCMAYLKKASKGNVRHSEIFFDPQTHMIERNSISIETIVNGLYRACQDGNTLDPPVDADLIMCFLRHRHPGCAWASPPAKESEALDLLQQVIDSNDGLLGKIIGVGLDSSESGNPPKIFEAVFSLAKKFGLRCVAHAGEEGPSSYITDALDILGCERIDHGVRCLEDDAVVERLVSEAIPLTVCPCSNHQLQVISRYFSGENPVRTMMSKGLKVTLNGDDPAYFFGHEDKFGQTHGGYIESNYLATAKECALTADELVKLALNSFESSFISKSCLQEYYNMLEEYCADFQ